MNDFEDFYKDGKEVNLNNLYSSLVECFSIILCGYAAGKFNLISSRETKGLDVFVRSFSLPSVIFMSLAQLDLTSVNWKFLASILVSKSIVFIGVIIVTLCISRPVNLGKLGLYSVFCTQSNDFALGYPILYALYGQLHPNYPAYVYLLAPISLAILNPIAYVLLEIENFRNEGSNSIQNSDGELPRIEIFDCSNENLEAENMVKSSSQQEKNLMKNNLKKKKSGIKLFSTVLKNIITNPVMCMTFLGIIGSSFYQKIKFVGIVLNAFAAVFSTTALFILGLKMVGSVYKLKGSAFITSGLLIITKLLVLPLVTREVVSLLHPGTNSSETLDLSTFGFMYGTFPTAPMVFVLATQYNTEIESISNSLVGCTFISAPLMYISAKMIFMKYLPTDNYFEKLQSFGFNLGVIGVPLGAWLIILFLANRAFNKVPHKIMGFLIISQIIICMGLILQPFVDKYKPWTAYFQFSILAFGIYSSRIWTCLLAVSLVFLQSRSLCFVIKLTPIFMCLAWGVTSILVSATCFVSFPDYSFESLMNPNFHRGKFQTIVTLLVLLISFVGTTLCLILQHHYYRRFKKYLSLLEETNTSDLQTINETRGNGNLRSSAKVIPQKSIVTDIEEIVSDNDVNLTCGDCDDGEDLCSSKFSCTNDQRELCEQAIKQYKDKAINENMDEDHQDHQILRHVVLLLCLATSMFVNLMLSIWTVVVEDAISGIYIELLFLNFILNSGQIFLTFGVFGFDSNNVVSFLFNRWRKLYYGAENIVLPPIDELGFETTHVCHQFIAHHLKNCEKEIAMNKRLKLRMYKDCFKGRTLVMWLQTKRLAKDENEAIQYASHLLEGRVLRHVENRHHFENSNLLYTFKSN